MSLVSRSSLVCIGRSVGEPPDTFLLPSPPPFSVPPSRPAPLHKQRDSHVPAAISARARSFTFQCADPLPPSLPYLCPPLPSLSLCLAPHPGLLGPGPSGHTSQQSPYRGPFITSVSGRVAGTYQSDTHWGRWRGGGEAMTRRWRRWRGDGETVER